MMTTAGESNPNGTHEVSTLRQLVQDGSLLCRRFRIKNQLGVVGVPGTIAFSMRATDELTDEDVVCKIPWRGEAALFQNLLNQYRFMRDLRSPRMPAALGFFREDELAHGEPFPFLVMELIRGEQAETWRHGKPLRERLRMFLDVVDTIADLNDRGVEHGDVHLGNILVESRGSGFLIDPDSQCLGSTFTDRVKAEGSTMDLGGLKHCLEALVEDEDPNVAAGLRERLGRDDLKVPTARELAVVLRSTLESKLLPGQSSEPLDHCASRYKDESAASVGIYRRNRQLRDLEFRRVRDLLKPMAEKFGFSVETNLAHGLLGVDSIVKPEEASESTPYGRFEVRELKCRTTDGDNLYFRFEGVPEFRRPWHDVPGLLSKGYLSVVFHGAQQAILMRRLELWFREGNTILGIREGDRFVTFGDGEIEHALRVLSGDTYPGIPEPVPPAARPWAVADLQAQVVQHGVLKKLRIPFDRSGKARQKNKQSLGMAMLQLVLALSPEGARNHGILGTRFHDLMTLPIQKRHQLVAEETGKIVEFLRHSIGEVRRFDVRPNDSAGQVLIFDIDAKMDCGSVRVTLRSDNGSRPRKVEVQSLESVAAPDPLAQLAALKSTKRRRPSSK